MWKKHTALRKNLLQLAFFSLLAIKPSSHHYYRSDLSLRKHFSSLIVFLIC